MKVNRNRICAIFFVGLAALTLVACSPDKTSSDTQRDTQERMVAEGVAQVGVPAITNFRELKIMKDLYELRDQTGLLTYTYFFNEMQGKVGDFLCDSIGYPIPYAAQITAPESVQRYYLDKSGNVEQTFGTEKLPQAEPNGLFSPTSAEGSWVMCKDPDSKEVHPAYVEPRVITLQFKLAR